MPSTHYPSSITHHLAARYTFASKERDEESGLSYFGSRYYSSDLSIWLSVDPMSDKYPSTSPYAYCRNNPIILVDPNGEFDTRSEARQYRKEHHTGGVIKKNDGKNPWGGNYSIENKKKGSSYTKINYQENESGHFIYGQDDEQVVCGPLISPKNNSERSSAQVLATTGLVCGTLGGDDVTGIGIADDIAIPVVAITGIGILLFKSHKQHASKSNWNRHSETRSGGDPETGRYGQNRNNNRGEKNKKFIPKPNPNKRK